jgi:hypothetical protein
VRFTSYLMAGEGEEFAMDVGLPLPGSKVMVGLPSGERREGTLLGAVRVESSRLRVTIEVPGEVEGFAR